VLCGEKELIYRGACFTNVLLILLTALVMKHLVLVGGGHSHAIALRNFAQSPIPNTKITLISDVSHAPYSGMIPGYIAGFYNWADCHINLHQLAQLAGATVIQAPAIGLDLTQKLVKFNQSESINFDVVSINIGSTPQAQQLGIPVKPISVFLNHWQQVMLEPIQSLGIIGAGVAGVELALNMQTKLQVKIHLFQRGTEILPRLNAQVRRHCLAALQKRQIQIHTQTSVEQVTKIVTGGFEVNTGTGVVECDRIFWATPAIAPPWLASSGLATDPEGFVVVNSHLQAVSYPWVFAAGDIASLVGYKLPKAGVFAVRQGPVLAHNLRQACLGKSLKPYRPQRLYLSLIGLGNRRAIASYGRFCWSGRLVWHWKDWLDRQFMAQFPKGT